MLDNLKILLHQGKQYIPDVTIAKVPGIFRGRPVISTEKVNETELIVGHSSINSVSLTFSVLITGLPLNMPGTFAMVTSGIYCLPWCNSIFRLSNIFNQ